jgi:tetratricopeptide (TPR) repeat protein
MKKIAILLFLNLHIFAQDQEQNLHRIAVGVYNQFVNYDLTSIHNFWKTRVDTNNIFVDVYSDVKVLSLAYKDGYRPDAYFFFYNDICTHYACNAYDDDMLRIKESLKRKKYIYNELNNYWYSDSTKGYCTFLPLEKTAIRNTTEITFTNTKPTYLGKPLINKTPPSPQSVKKTENMPQAKKTAPSKKTAASKTDSYYIASGLKKFDAKNYLGSIIDNTKALQINPFNDTAYINRAVSKVYIIDSLNSAIVDLSKALALNTTRAALVYHVRGLIKGNLEDYRGAELDFSLALGEDNITPELSITCYVDRARACISLKNYAQAIADYSSAIELNPTFADYYNLRGNARALDEDIDGACIDWYLAKDLGSTEAVKSFKTFCK